MTHPTSRPVSPLGRDRVLQRVELLVALVARNLKVRHGGRALGAVGSLGPIVVQLGVLTFVFDRVVPTAEDDYAAFLASGLIAWVWFSAALNDAPWSIVHGRDLVRRPRFPPVLLPAVSIGAPLATFTLALPIVLAVIWADTGRVPASAALVPLVAAVQAIVMLGPALLVAEATVRNRWLPSVVSAVLTVLFYGSPILYSATEVPDSARIFYDLNPLTHMLDAYRDVLVHGQVPGRSLLVVLGAGVVLAGAARVVFARHEGRFVDDL